MTRRTVAHSLKQNPPQLEAITADTLPLMLDEKRAAAHLGVSLAYLRRSRSEGKTGNRTEAPRFVRVDGRVFYRVTDLTAWVAALESRAVV